MQMNLPYLAVILLLIVFFSRCQAQTEKRTSEIPLFSPAAGSPISIEAPANVMLADLNKDGKPDLIIACSKTKSLVVLEGQGDGTFRKTGQSEIVLPEPPHEMVLADFNGDLNPDLAIANHDSYQVRILPGDGTGRFTKGYPIMMKEGNHPHTHGLASGDFNEDGKPDLITANNADSDVAIVFGTGKGRFVAAPGSPFPVNKEPYPLTLGDINHDSHLDIAVSSTEHSIKDNPSRVLTVMLGKGEGSFKRLDVPLRTPKPWYIGIGDVNGDQKADLAATHWENSKLTILTGDGTGHFKEVPNSPFDLGNNAWCVALADVNGDGLADAMAAAKDGICIMLSDGTGNFNPAPGSPFQTGKGTWRFAMGDINGDGKPDIVSSNLESDNVSILLSR